jgi:hypothetical protein
MQDILSNIRNFDEIGFYFSHGHSIPESHNICVDEALMDEPDYVWLCEDDQSYPHDILDRMIKADVDLAVCDYPVGIGKLPCIKYAKNGDIQYAGTGCVLVKPWIFHKIGYPYFRTDTIYMEDTMEPVENNIPNPHGLHDVDFWVRALKLNPSYSVVDRIGHYKLDVRLPDYKVEKWS